MGQKTGTEAQTSRKRVAPGKNPSRERMHLVFAGHVDHGKSTVIGRMLADTGSLPEGKLEQVKKNCERNAKPFEYAFLLDALKDEQSQGITIDAARIFFKTQKRDYLILDAPGHIEFLKNMATGASHAEAAMLVIDAEEGVQENSRRHGYLLSMLGVGQLVVLVNKMDLVTYSQDTYESVVKEYSQFLSQIGLEAEFIPVSGREGVNIKELSDRTPWYKGQTVVEAMDGFWKQPPPVEKSFRMPVQDVYKFTQAGDKRRIVAGTVDSGRLSVGDEVAFYPSGKRSRVKSIEAFGAEKPTYAQAGQATAFTLEEQIYVSRGEIAALAGEPEPKVSRRIRVSLFWMGKQPLVKGKSYRIKIGTANVEGRLDEVIRVMDGSNLDATEEKEHVDYHDVGECIFSLRKPIAFDLPDEVVETSRFVIVDEYEIRGGGLVREPLGDDQLWVRDYVMQRNTKWAVSDIGRDDRAERYNQKASLVLITGPRAVGKKTLARRLEQRLFLEGKFVYFLGIANVLYGVDADIKVQGSTGDQPEHIRRLAEVTNLMLDAGMIVVATAIELSLKDLEIIREAVDTDSIYTIWIGEEKSDIESNLIIPRLRDVDATVDELKGLLQSKGVIFRP